MIYVLWDASSLVKNYLVETGSATVDALLVGCPGARMVSTLFGYAEVAAILRRKLNVHHLTQVDFADARARLRQDVLLSPGFVLLSVGDDDVLDGVTLTDRHNLNTSDAAMLVAFLRYARDPATGTPRCVLVAADQRLLRAAAAEGLATLNPEVVAPDALPAVLASLSP